MNSQVYSVNSNTSLINKHGKSGAGNLERIRISTFSGNKTEFQHWKATFTSCVDATAYSAQFKMLTFVKIGGNIVCQTKP